MKVPYSWLKDYVKVNIQPERLAHFLTMTGTTVENVSKIGDDYIFEFEITANRSDCLSMIGVARETACILGKKLKIPKELQGTQNPKSKTQNFPIGITIKNPDLCLRYTARIIRNIEVSPSPEPLKKKIISSGLRPVNNIVDITNFVLLETGQPMHAFDLDKIEGDVAIRKARDGEKIITIDNVQRALNSDTLVVADSSGAIAIAGVMGGQSTEVTGMTKNILLESANFAPVSVRRTSRALGLSSESSYRFERKVDNQMVDKASGRASLLIRDLAKGEIGAFLDKGAKKSYSKTISFDIDASNDILGISVKKSEIHKTLKALGFGIKEKKGAIAVSVPSFRKDITQPVDITEEIARIHGYENFPTTIPQIVGNTTLKEDIYKFREKIRNTLASEGLYEIITYSLIARDDTAGISIKNPLSIDQEVMRSSLLPGALKVVSHNLNRKAKNIPVFEIGNVYKEKENAFLEEAHISIALSGLKRDDWKLHGEEYSFFDLKGIVENLFSELGLGSVAFNTEEIGPLAKSASASLEIDGKYAGFLGEVKDETLDTFDIKKKVFYGEINLKKLFDNARKFKKYASLSRYPSVERDISVIADRHVRSADIVSVIHRAGERLVKRILLVDCYTGRQIPSGKAGLLYRIEYRSQERTLEDSEVDALHAEIKSALSGELNISFR
ncbi:MAG: phenylalanine--tRNA ligase subunit beta [Candidatus Omnitrophica bacterium]|nr:phenylalanine--tRNA ligase subunit beta [Candidatus Omnitrophota bacterium]